MVPRHTKGVPTAVPIVTERKPIPTTVSLLQALDRNLSPQSQATAYKPRSRIPFTEERATTSVRLAGHFGQDATKTQPRPRSHDGCAFRSDSIRYKAFIHPRASRQ
jgi:hypothetical protein